MLDMILDSAQSCFKAMEVKQPTCVRLNVGEHEFGPGLESERRNLVRMYGNTVYSGFLVPNVHCTPQ